MNMLVIAELISLLVRVVVSLSHLGSLVQHLKIRPPYTTNSTVKAAGSNIPDGRGSYQDHPVAGLNGGWSTGTTPDWQNVS